MTTVQRITSASVLTFLSILTATSQRGPQPAPQRGALPQLQRGGPQVQAPPGPLVIRINVNLVQVDAIVTDSRGNAVTDLKMEDFELLQDNKPQTITAFEFVNVKEAAALGAAPRGNQPRGGVPLPPAPQRGLRPQQIRRTIALVVDDLGLSFDSIARVRDSLNKWVDSEMQPGDLVAVIRTSAGMGSLQQFTADKRLLRSAIDLVKFHVGRVGASSFAPLSAANGIGPDTADFDLELSRMYSVGSLGAIQYVVQGLRDVPGRKSLILFSESMQLMFPNGRNQDVEDRLRRLSDAANRSSVVLYGVDPRGVAYTGLTAEDSAAGRTPQQLAQVASQRTNDLFNSREGMETLAQKTGGLFVHDNNDISDSLRQAVDDGNGYYLLGYNPDDTTFQDAVAKFHPITVRLKRPGLTVRSRTGFFGTPDRGTPIPRTPIAQITRALSAPFVTGDLSVRLTALFSHAEKTGSSIEALLYFEPRDLTFTQDADGSRVAQFDIAVVTFDAEGNQIEGTNKTWRLRVPQDKLAEATAHGSVYAIHVPTKKPGAYQMRVVLRDSGSQRLGSATSFIEIPDIKKGRLALSGLMLGEDQSAAVAADLQEGEVAARNLNTSPAVRVFSQGTWLVYAYEIFNAKTDRNKKTQLEVQMRLFRDGQRVNTEIPARPAGSDQKNPERLIGTGRLQLTRIAPGDYALQVIVTDKLANEKNRIAAQSMDFEVR